MDAPAGALLVAFDEPLADELPVGEILDDGFHEACAIVLIVQIVRMLPDVARPQCMRVPISGLSASCVVVIASLPPFDTSQAQPLPN